MVPVEKGLFIQIFKAPWFSCGNPLGKAFEKTSRGLHKRRKTRFSAPEKSRKDTVSLLTKRWKENKHWDTTAVQLCKSTEYSCVTRHPHEKISKYACSLTSPYLSSLSPLNWWHDGKCSWCSLMWLRNQHFLLSLCVKQFEVPQSQEKKCLWVKWSCACSCCCGLESLLCFSGTTSWLLCNYLFFSHHLRTGSPL